MRRLLLIAFVLLLCAGCVVTPPKYLCVPGRLRDTLVFVCSPLPPEISEAAQ